MKRGKAVKPVRGTAYYLKGKLFCVLAPQAYDHVLILAETDDKTKAVLVSPLRPASAQGR